LPGGNAENHEKCQIADVQTEIRTEHLSNTRLERYLYIKTDVSEGHVASIFMAESKPNKKPT
jgi:hypothetical protein